MKFKNIFGFTAFCLMLSFSIVTAQPAQSPQTFCNPLNLNYRFMVDAVDAREAADAVIVLFKDDYYLFASRSGGYWTSSDLHNWSLIVPTGIDIETYAPAVVAMRDTLFYIPSASGQVYKCGDPKSGIWQKGPVCGSYGDPDLFLDDDGRLYMCYGLSNTAPIRVVELDPVTFKEIGTAVVALSSQAAIHGWERRGDDNLLDEFPWIEGSWMVKENNKYYLHYAGPGTEFKTYADGIYVADSPTGPFTYANYSPVDFKPTGFICGAGHGSTFKDKNDQYWHIGTMTISIKHMFERRLGLFPVAFDVDGNIHCNTAFGDYPQYLPGVKETPIDDNFAGMLLLSHKKFVTASSSLTDHSVGLAVDEDARTYWSAQTGDSDEWLMIDLGQECSIEAIQVNFAEHDTDPMLVRGRDKELYERYTVQYSNDGMNWNLLVDKSQNTQDVPHDYIELNPSVTTRYLKLDNMFTPGNGNFAVRDLRIFGNSGQAVFTELADFTIQRDAADGRDATISWTPVQNADGYVVRYGIAPGKLYNHYMVYDTNSVAIHSLNHGVEYYFNVEAFDCGLDYYNKAGEFRSFQSGDWGNINSWERHNGSTWVPAGAIPDQSDGPITILSGHTLTLTATDSVNEFTVDSGGVLIVNSGTTLFVSDGLGIDMRVSGTVENSGIIVTENSASISFENGGTYFHEQQGGTVPQVHWGPGSSCEIPAYTSGSKPGNLNQDFCNFCWNSSGQTSNVDWGWYNNTITGDIIVKSSGSAKVYMTSPGAGSPNTIAVNGNIIVEGGQFSSNGSSSIADITINTYGDIEVTGGNFSVSRGSGPTVTWKLFGDFSMANATTQNSNAAGARFIFSGSMPQTLTLGEGNTITALPIEVGTGATLNMNTSILQGSGILQVDSSATIGTAHAAGLDGAIQIGQNPIFDEMAGFTFNGSESQITGTLLPGSIGNLNIDNSSSVTLSGNLVVNGTFNLTSGEINLDGHTVSYGPAGSLRYSHNTRSQTTSDAEFPMEAGPTNLIIDNPRDVELHASRNLSGNLDFQRGKLRLGSQTLSANSTSNSTDHYFVDTRDGGSLKLPVGTSKTLIPIGASNYAPVWISNTGTEDIITASVVRESTPAPYGGRVKAKWYLDEETVGNGNYTLQFGWISSFEETAFATNRASCARIFILTDTTEAGSGDYVTQFSESPYSVARGGITTLGPFGVGRFGFIPSAIELVDQLPIRFRLEQNYPNPFNPTTTIRYDIPKTTDVTLTIFNMNGQVVERLVNQKKQEPGFYTIDWNARNVSSGVYLYQIQVNDPASGGAEQFQQVKKCLLIK